MQSAATKERGERRKATRAPAPDAQTTATITGWIARTREMREWKTRRRDDKTNSMTQLILRGLAAGFLVVAVAELARRWPRVGSLILTLPIVIPVVFVVMYLRDADVRPISRMAREILFLIPLGLPFFVPLALAERWGLSFWPAFATGLLLVTLTITAYLLLTPRGV